MEEDIKGNLLKKWVVVFVVVVAVLFGMYSLFNSSGSPSGLQDQGEVQAMEFKPSERVKGAEEAIVEIVEFADFECSACAIYGAMLNKLLDDYPNELRVVYKHFPLVQIHRNSLSAAKAVEAAGEQGEFWGMYDRLFENQKEWVESGDVVGMYRKYASELGLDVDKFESDMGRGDIASRIDNDRAEGNGLRINSTPTLFVNGYRITNPRAYAELVQIVEGVIAKNESAVGD